MRCTGAAGLSERALAAVAALRRATIVPVDESLALEAADVALERGLAMADAIVFATAQRHGATLVTGDLTSTVSRRRADRVGDRRAAQRCSFGRDAWRCRTDQLERPRHSVMASRRGWCARSTGPDGSAPTHRRGWPRRPLETFDGVLDRLLALADEAQVVEGDTVITDCPLEGARRVVRRPRWKSEMHRVGRRRHRVDSIAWRAVTRINAPRR
jgi:hypothetical protein